MANRLYGVIPPLLTLFKENGEVDLEATGELAEILSKHVHALFVCGTYGNGPLMSEEERIRVLETVAKKVAGQIPLIAHVGATNTPEAVRLAKHAEKVGAIAVAAVPPYYFHHSEERVIKHFSEIIKSVSIPVYVYNNPKTVGYPVTPALMAKLETIGIKGVKDSSFDILMLEEYRLACSDDFDVVLGTEAMFLPAYVLGIQAFVPGLANAFPELVRSLFDACINDDLKKAKSLHDTIYKLRKIAYRAGASNVGVLVLLHMRGFRKGYPRLPFVSVEDDKYNSMKKEVEELFEGTIPQLV